MEILESMRGALFKVLNLFGESSLEIEQLGCLERKEQSVGRDWVLDMDCCVYSQYQCSLKDCLQFLKESGEKDIVEEMRLLPRKVKEYTNGGLTPISDRFLNDVNLCVMVGFFRDTDNLFYLTAVNDIQWYATDEEGGEGYLHHFYDFDMDETEVMSAHVPFDKIDSIIDEIKIALNQPEFSLLKPLEDIKAKFDPESPKNHDPLDYPYVVLDYFPSLFKVDLFRKINDKVIFGKFDDNPITWTVLNVDHEENAYLLLADSVLYDMDGKEIRASLEEFYSRCFNKEEKARIIENPRSTYLTPWEDDSLSNKHLFLLSQLEILSMYRTGKERREFTNNGKYHYQCWLRDYSSRCGVRAAVTAHGKVVGLALSEMAGIRPALWMRAF